MKISYGSEEDILRIVFAETLVDESDETKPGVILDYDSNGKIIGMEILDASTAFSPKNGGCATLIHPTGLRFAVTVPD